ncbi:MAG: hypothetical protein HY743_09490 [Deltaproteobacteria bacterium]|nr:hypothetical protein [Deltaproteobacteria bacterium]
MSNKTPCGYPQGPLKASDGTIYLVQKTGQILRTKRKMDKAERKRHKKARRENNDAKRAG